MKPSRIHALLVGALLLQACAGTGGTEAQAPGASTRMSNAELEALYRARQDSALMRVSDADVRFMTGMIGHHAQALVMAGFAPANDAGRQIRTLTARSSMLKKTRSHSCRGGCSIVGNRCPRWMTLAE